MQMVTLAVAGAGALGALYLRPSRAILAYLVVLCCYPQYVTIPVGTVDFTSGRIVILVVLARLVFGTDALSRFRFNMVDGWVFAAWALSFASLSTNAPFGTVFEREFGVMFDTLFVYAAARLSILATDDIVAVTKTLMIVGVPLACLGFYQSMTGHNVIGFMTEYDPWRPRVQPVNERSGFYRADLTFALHIAFGMFFSILVALGIGMWPKVRWRWQIKAALIGFMLLGVFSSMSSGPLLATVVGIAIICFYPLRKQFLYFAVATMLVCIAIELYSNQHLPHALSRFALSSHTASYRIQLWEEALGGGMDEHWTFGYGYVGLGPGTDNTEFDWRFNDLLNIYLAKLVRTGLVGMIPLLVATMLPYFRFKRGFSAAPTDDDRWLLWCVLAGFVGWHIALQTVNFQNQIYSLFYFYLAMVTNVALFYERRQPDQTRMRPSRVRWAQ